MKTLTATLLEEQKADSRDPYLKVVVGDYTFGTDRIIKLVHEQQPFSDKATIFLDNSDDYLTDKNLKGNTVTMGLGLVTGSGNEYIDKPRMKVKSQLFHSAEGSLTCELHCMGMINELGNDRASDRYEGEADKTVQDLLDIILDAYVGCVFDHCESYQNDFTGGGGLINTVKPGSSFMIPTNGTRLEQIKRLLDLTWCVMRPENDGKVHIFKPTTTGEVYDYEYELGSGKHEFFYKSQSNTLVIPNKIRVRTQMDADPYIEGWATCDYSDYKEVLYTHIVHGVADSWEANDIAEAILSKFQMHAQNAGATVPINLGAEIFDYVKITDSREGTTVVGNVGYIRTVYDPNENDYNHTIGLGDWLSVRRPELDAGGLPGEGNYFPEMVVDTLYLSPISLDYIEDGVDYQRVKSAALSAEGLVLLDEVQDTDGTYKKVLATQVSAGKIYLSNQCIYGSGYNPTDKFDLNFNDLDDVPEGTYYGRVLRTDLSAGHLYISDSCFYKSGYDPSGKMPGDADLDDIPDGVNYKRILSTQLSAGKLYLTSSCVYGSGYDPTDKFDLNWNTLDNIPNGASYGRVLLTDLSAGHLYIYDGCIFKDDYDPTDKFDMGDDSLDDIPDGMTYKKLLGTQISAGKIYLSSASLFAANYDPSTKWTGTDLDDLPDGTLYARLKQTDMQAGHIYLTDEAYFAAGYDPTGKFDLGQHNLDNVSNGSSYHKLLATQIDSGYIKLTSNSKFEGAWYTDSDITIQAGVGIKGTHLGTTQFELSSTTGKITAAAGNVVLDSGGLKIYGSNLALFYYGASLRGCLGAESDKFCVYAENGQNLVLGSDGGDVIMDNSVYPKESSGLYLGGPGTSKWTYFYRTNEYTCPLPTTNSAIDLFKKIKKPKITNGDYGDRHYFQIEDFPAEMKHNDDIELTRTIGVTVQAVREVVEEIGELSYRLKVLENAKH